MTFSFDISPILISLLALNVVVLLYTAVFHRKFLTKVCKKQDREHESATISNTILPPLSVVVYCRDNAEGLSRLLPQILGQDYPSPFEVIIVNDGSSESVKDVFNYLSQTHTNLYQTFIPLEANNISPKKLAVTLGVKAARHDYVVFTNADAVINSTRWLHRFGEEFATGKEVVFGNSVPTAECATMLGATSRLDILSDRIETFSPAISGKAYRCTTYNMGYRKSLFFDDKGFSRNLNLNYGDDDIFIRLLSSKENTSVILDDDSTVECDYVNPRKYHSLTKQRHIYTDRLTPAFGRNMMRAGTASVWIWLLSTVATIWFAVPNVFPIAAATLVAIPFWWTTIASWSKASKVLKIRVSLATLPFLLFARPFYNLHYRIKTHRNRRLFQVIR